MMGLEGDHVVTEKTRLYFGFEDFSELIAFSCLIL